jgi:hypothetical protein
MYNTTFRCTYNLIDSNDKEDMEISDDLYRSQFLQAFNSDDWTSDDIDKMLEYINNELMKNDYGKQILLKIKEKNILPIKNMETIILFSYEYFYLLHNCLIDLFNNGDISNTNYNKLIQKIENS